MKLRQWTGTPWLTVLTYHRVTGPGALAALDREVVTDTVEFERQLAFLKTRFDFVGIDDVVAALDGHALPRMPLLLTFDDGYRDNYEIALPLLQKHGARAVFFVATSFIEDRKLFWWDRLHWIVERSRREVLNLEYPSAFTLPLGPDASDRARALRKLLGIVKTSYGLSLPRFMDGLERAAGESISADQERVLADRHVMTWDQVRALRRSGMDVQSHTHTHRALETLPFEEIEQEFIVSRTRLQEALDAPVNAISYPVGRANRYSDRMRAALQAAGYRVGFSNRSGVNFRTLFDPFDLRRISTEGTEDASFFEAIMAVPALAY